MSRGARAVAAHDDVLRHGRIPLPMVAVES